MNAGFSALLLPFLLDRDCGAGICEYSSGEEVGPIYPEGKD